MRTLALVVLLLQAAACTHGKSGSDAGVPASLSAEAKISNAEKAGTIDHDHALLYYLYAATANVALPAEYHADGPDDRPLPELTLVMNDVLADYPSMSADLQGLFAPFMMRPDQAGSAWLGTDMTYAPSPATSRFGQSPQATPHVMGSTYAGHVDAAAAVRIWYPTMAQQALATQIAAEIDASGMYTTEAAIMGGATPCDDSFLNPTINGGSGALDMYIVDFDVAFPHRLDPSAAKDFVAPEAEGVHTFAEMVPEHLDTMCSTTYVLLRDGALDDNYRATLAHELFHSFQHGVPGWIGRNSNSWNWVDEATAVWAEDQVYPTKNTEQIYLSRSATSNWDTRRATPPDCAGGRPEAGPLDCVESFANPAYSSYLFFFALTRELGVAPTIVGQLYHQFSSKSLDAVHSLVPDFDAKWKQFALWNYNAGPGQHYQDSGQAFASSELAQTNTWLPPMPGAQPPHIATDHADDLAVNVGPTRIGYYELTVDDGSTPDEFVKQLDVDLSELQGKTNLHLQAIIDIGKPSDATYQRVLEDWTTVADRHFCRDSAAEYVTRIVLIADNSNVSGSAITGSAHGLAKAACGAYQGQLTQDETVSGTYADSNLPGTVGHLAGSLHVTSSWTVTFVNRDQDTNDAIYSIAATNVFLGSYNASLDGNKSDASTKYERMDTDTDNVSQTITNPAGPGDPSSIDPGYGPSDLGTIDVDSQGNYRIYFITGLALIDQTYSTKTVSTSKNIYSSANPAPSGSGCGTDEIITSTETYDSSSNVIHDQTLLCSEITGDQSSDPSELRPAVGQVGSNIDLFMGKLDSNGEIHGTMTIPSTECGLTGLAGLSIHDGTCTGSTTIELSVKLPPAS